MASNVPPDTFEWIGAFFGIVGTLIAALSSNIHLLFLTFVAYAVSNVMLAYAGKLRGAHALLTMQLVYGCTTVVGLVHHFPGGAL